MEKVMPNKKAYYQGGGGVNEPTPGKPKYKADKAITVQPRFVEPFYRNYDLYDVEGVDGPAKHGPGSGWNHMNDFNSVKEFLDFRRQKLKGKYVAEDSWIEDTVANRKERVEKMKLRASALNRIVKTASGDHFRILCSNCGATTAQCRCPGYFHDSEPQTIRYADSCGVCKKTAGPNYDLGTGLYDNLDKYDSVEDFRKHKPKGQGALMDVNHIDFPIDDQVTPIEGNMGTYVDSIPISYQENYTAEPDQDGKGEETLDFGEDLTNEEMPSGRPFESADPQPKSNKVHKKIDLDKMEQKYLTPAETEIYGLPDGVDSEAKDADQTISTENPDYGITDSGRQMYGDKWNI
jgi:hypothetical protein